MTINVDYISVVRKNAYGFEYDEISINHSHQETLKRLDSMVKDDNMTACEMASYFASCFPIQNDFSYCYPNNYWDYNYGPSAGVFPEFVKKEEYSRALDSEKKKFKEALTNSGKYTSSEIDKEISNHIKRLISTAKEKFYEKSMHYVEAFDYYTLLRRLESDRSIKMFSTEVIGEYNPKATMTFKLTEDISFSLHTNFRFGNSSCFFMKMSYKGILLLFYSDYIKYYFANAIDIVRYTKQYSPQRECWPDALKMVVEYSNMAHRTPKRFEEEFVEGQLSDLLNGLRDIMSGHVSVKNHIATRFAQSPKYIGLRAISGSDIEVFGVYPNEMNLVFKSEKITGALDLLESMRAFTNISSKVEGTISEIKRMNEGFAPQINKALQEAESNLIDLNNKISALTAEENRLTALIEPYWAERSEFLASVNRTECPEPLKMFEEEHPDFVEYTKQKSIVVSERALLSREKNYRLLFRNRLQNCLEKISGYNF